jgi:hypothetical protein
MADYIFVYFTKGSHLGSSPWSGELEIGKSVARQGLLRRSADEFQIRSSTLNGPLVWEESRTLIDGRTARWPQQRIILDNA